MLPEYRFTIFHEPAISTLDLEWRDKFISENNAVAREVRIKGRTLRSILDEYQGDGCIDLISIDAEGSDLDVLKSLEFESLEKSRFPRWLLLEASPPVVKAMETPAVILAMEWGYEPFAILPYSTLLKLKA
jgi:hypothetical protein